MATATDDDVRISPLFDAKHSSYLETAIVPRTRDLGDGFEVRRALPSSKRQMVGPFIFFDQMGPAILGPGKGLDVRPHPHIGLATVTYLFEGEIVHRDSLGTTQVIRPGAVNWMTAGKGIVHSERSSAESRAGEEKIFGIQTWLALPNEKEEMEPAFIHYAEDELPLVSNSDQQLRLIAGTWQGITSPVQTHSPTFYADVILAAGAQLVVPGDYSERAAYVVAGEVSLTGNGDGFASGHLLIFQPRKPIVLSAGQRPARFVLFGGEPLDGPRYIWWNFVSSSRQRIATAKADWKAGRFGRVPDDDEFIPLPDEPPPAVRYP